ncbi:LPXTG cell wall anchor domain-containing protein [Staphylococcus simiae]|uniref:Gram-positive cocci surface proteins LPxTG domain-containing protein n=1 Tax=Staphylococcus simiae CCM 7213 = CCUG 51256 TaxID=911238 RepID=G5JF69_9STAP|nr:LPXTG cell wall anchor domain-containing protein [Staphylococcus simiae]EHJ09161.1 hypothetical protein SS7213T_00304 [Staphylococcus simiae CCM 7213 = CCUG 51256]PNZ13914.1 cell surface protein [Staphylococcus simiae]SNV58909.1 LPXTG-motif surface-anchored protein [Staphylococcus simiae]
MKKVSLLATTTLAGALLFTGLESGHEAKAAEINANQAKNAAVNISKGYTEAGKVSFNKDYTDEGNFYRFQFYGEEDNGVGFIDVYKDGNTIKYSTPRSGPDGEKVVHGDFLNGQNANTATSNNQQVPSNNAQNQTPAPNNNAQNQTQNQNNMQQPTNVEQAPATHMTELPATGEQASNSTFIAVIASALMAVGSVLTFKRFSKNK